ncbi:hypothetical protein LTR78_001275 [Recurvomyces mirabilis]|uniref:Carboxylic ester hydrolase n=1 Tax=Recurvomyces mirabilis TaxID=574656 RepID=A0AAE0WVZ5_9PEZI|nr:hypothetical protein LTR78_001275 [Recurvomyces mirabilis]KAK5161252.1 hypothetical protein LTS14_001048 [Recurvomyces mirabilis]
MLVQRYPDAYDGILALAPAINWAQFIVAEYWPQQVMNRLGYYPLSCELDAITAPAIDACDELDGVKDGVISLPGECHFDAVAMIGQTFNCHGTEMLHSPQAAQIANAAWTGPHNSSLYAWYGLNRDSSLTTGLANTTCSNNNDAASCIGNPFAIASQWIKLFLAKDENFDITALPTTITPISSTKYQSKIGTADPDLSRFRHHGGKIIAWHGLADRLIFPNGTVQYYERVLDLDPHAADFYRFFEAPGTDHCRAGSGPYPNDTLAALVDWVEREKAPQTLTAVDAETGAVRRLCAYPATQRYIGGDPLRPESFACEKVEWRIMNSDRRIRGSRVGPRMV